MRTIISLIALFLVVLVILLPPPPAYSAANIWAVDDTEKIRPADHGSSMQKDQDGTVLSQSPYNLVWQNGQVHIFGAQNEFVAFQLIVEANGSPTTIQALTLPKLCHSSGFCIENTGNADDYYDYRGKHIDILSEHYMPVQNLKVDSDSTRYPDPYYLDEVPEILVPITAPSGKGGLPLTVPTNTNQAIWFDIYVPKEAPAGDYTGTLAINTDGSNQTIPVNLKVYNFQLPDETHLKHFFRLAPGPIVSRLGIRNSIREAAFREEITKYFQAAYRHRALLANTATIPFLDDFYLGFYNGDYYNAANKYYGPGEDVGHNMYPVGIFDLCGSSTCFASRTETDGQGSGFAPPTEAQWRSASDAWVNWFNDPSNGVSDMLYARHMPDEPNHPASESAWAYAQLQMYASWLHNNPGPGGNLKTLCTAPMVAETIGYCDVWALNKAFYKVDEVAAARARGEIAGIYNGGNPMYGAGMFLIHTAAVDARVLPWVMERYGIDFYFLYGVISAFQGDCNFFHDNCSLGTLFYLSDDPLYPAEARGFNGPLLSVRFKYWRRGVQDFEYMWLAKQNGLNTQVGSIVTEVVPRALDETPWTPTDHENPWPDRGYQFEQRRRQLAELLETDPGSQSIPLPAGWNMISSNREPDNPDLETLFSSIENDLIIVKNGDGQVYWPAQNINNIGNWSVNEGYLVYMDNHASITISGSMVDPAATSINLQKDWNLVSYLRSQPMPVDQALASLGSKLYVAKNNVGQIYWPEFGLNEIGNLQPGQGYQVFLTGAGTLTYPDN